MNLPRTRRMWIVAGLAAAAFASAAEAQTAATAEQVKAAYLHKFGGYVDWPAKAFPDATTPFVIAVVGAEGLQGELARLVAGRTVQGRAVQVRAIADGAVAPNDVHLVFVGRDVAADATAATLALYRGHPVLTVTDRPSGLESGAMLNFVEVDHRVRFEAQPATAELAGLHLSSRLLAVAVRVAGTPP